jgi:CheY-like chemotaxis protein
MKKEQILVVEDEFITAADIKRSLIRMGYDVPATVDNGPGAIEKAGEIRPALVLMDINLIGEMNGIEAARQIRTRYDIPVVFLTAQSDDATVEKAVSTDPFGYITKPLEERTLKTNIQIALFKNVMEKKIKEQDRTIRTLINTTADGAVLLNMEGTGWANPRRKSRTRSPMSTSRRVESQNNWQRNSSTTVRERLSGWRRRSRERCMIPGFTRLSMRRELSLPYPSSATILRS